jgi:predicted amidohydrolase YtcJ
VLRKVVSIAFAAGLIPAHAFAADPPAQILFNGRVLTMDASDRVAQAVAIDGDRIVAVGSNEEVQRLAGSRTRLLDLAGRTVIPGLGDAHNHAIRGGQTYRFETYWYDVTTLAVALEVLKEAAAKKGSGKWVAVAGSWAPEQFRENRAPTFDDLTAALPDNPAYVQYLYDYAVVNARGIAALGLDKRDASIPGIEIERETDGRPTGKLFGNIGSFSGLFARIAASDDEERKQSLEAYFAALNARGVTAIVDAAGGGSGGAVYDPLFALHREGKLPLRVAYRVSAQMPGNEAAWYSSVLSYMPPRFGDAKLRFLGLGEIVVFKANDGVRMAPGFDAQNDGREELYKVAVMAARRKYPLEIHAYTDDAAKQILDVFERVSQTVDIRNLRWCIAHVHTATRETFERMKKLGICYSVQMGPYFEALQLLKANPAAVVERATPTKIALEEGLMVVGGTDSTRIGEYSPWRAIEYHITGRAIGGSVQRRPEFALTRQQALRLYTSSVAWVTFDEGDRGTIEPGRLADLAVLDQPYLTMPADRIHTLRSVLTMVGGIVVHGEARFETAK